MEITDKKKYLAVAVFFFAIIGFALFFKLRAIYFYIVILIFSVYVINYLKLASITGEVSKLVLAMCGVLIAYILLSYYFRFVVIDPNKPNVMKAISLPPITIGLVLAPIIEELGFRRIFLGSLLKAGLHWFIACTLTTILFIIVHPPSNWIHMIVGAFLFSTIYAFSGNLKLVIFLHFCTNAIFYIDPRIWTK